MSQTVNRILKHHLYIEFSLKSGKLSLDFIKNISILFFTLIFPLSIQAQTDHYPPDPYWQGTLGPLNIRSLSPGQALRLAPLPRSPYGLPEGRTEIQFNIGAASIFLQSPGRYLIDFNFIDSRIAINHGFSNGWSTELSFNDRRIQNLYLDEMVESFHDAFGIDQNGRDINQNQTRVIIPQYSANFAGELEGVFSQTLGLSIQKVLIDKTVEWPAVAITLNTSLETLSDGMIEKGAFDYGLQFSLAQKKSSGYFYANASYTRFGSDKTLQTIPLSKSQLSGMLGYEFSIKENQALIVQYLFSEGVMKNLGALDKISHEIHLGYKWRTEKNIYEAGLVENIINFDNGPDVAFTFGITHRL
ncbi:hypothetical protein MNBD_GAMMA09-2549 [hydrothermal vent metagenome]|uniref:DUF3187 family protein n=1 Tax=hydrothermal vent metagenome TaxID=652676 RepID=A0A3B0XQ18_9ZZZZ